LINQRAAFIIYDMRFFMLAVMMVLLPLRGWTGDAMATEMALNSALQQMHLTVAAPEKADARPGHQGHQNQEGHGDHAAHEATLHLSANTPDYLSHANCDQTHGAGHNAGHCESCSACQACHNVALLVDSDELKPRLNTLWTPTGAADPFASADAAPDQKPPIS
jgi:hypothetical protein